MDDFDHSPSSRPIDLYISFRGVDDFDACKFIYPLFAALKSALEIDGLSAFWDDKKLETANSDIPPHHLRAIQQSCISVVVFSKTFASSVWSLQELSEIAARINDRRHTIIPIFYDVDPSEVRKQKNAYKQAFAEHEERFPADLDQINRWRNAMTQVANLCGWHVPYDPGSSYSKVIDDITTDVKKKMGGVIKSYEGDGIYQVRLLTKEQALQLFCKTAFRRDYPASEKVEAIVLNLEDSEGTTLKIEALAQMTNLRVLVLENVNFAGTLTSLSNKLRYVSWHQYPCTCLPSNFESFSLVELIMPYSNVTEIWEGKKVFPNLRNMNFHGSKALIGTPDFGGVPNLERLDLEGCIGLLQLHPSIAKLSKLNFLNLRNCINLAQIPKDMFSLPSLEDLNIIRCPKLNIV
ncbi:disease resistance protein RUN1-like isoform X3 [Prosopis cineraria]|uniref:disease resistance protein RUN1-like isoform X3 n=1 Tax=Prosopis cineraria TaxID=364024 RepID=UPI0024103843|nr:disease resistance protein RUN1-like isoform X3 [Prosopis cineraria]